jgi:hypothetical protein
MARKKNLAGLAALAGLAYMASRDKAVKGGAPVVNAPAAVPGMSKAAEMDPLEAANASPESQKIMEDAVAAGNQEKGSRMLDEMRDAELAPKRRPKPVANPASNFVTPEEGARAYRSRARSPDPGFVTPEEGARAYRSRARSPDPGFVTPEEGARAYRSRSRANSSDMGFKKGGSVKGWGMARGARKAKTY